MRYAVLGAQGQLGRDLCRLWGNSATPLGRAEVDLARPDTLRAALGPLRPDVVVNCAAFNFVDRAEREPEAAFAVNALGAQHAARACAEIGAVFVHFSSD